MNLEQTLMHDFDGEKYEKAFCNKIDCHCCEGTDYSGEPNGYGCDARDDRVERMYQSILKRRLKKSQTKEV